MSEDKPLTEEELAAMLRADRETMVLLPEDRTDVERLVAEVRRLRALADEGSYITPQRPRNERYRLADGTLYPPGRYPRLREFVVALWSDLGLPKDGKLYAYSATLSQDGESVYVAGEELREARR